MYTLYDARLINFSAAACLSLICVCVTAVLILQVSSLFGHTVDGQPSSLRIGFDDDLIKGARTGERMWHLSVLLRS